MISNIAQITRDIRDEVHHQIIKLVSSKIENLPLDIETSEGPEVRNVRIREVLFDHLEGNFCAQIFIDLGYPEAGLPAISSTWDQLTTDPLTANSAIDFNLCLMIHKWVLDSDIFESFTDDLEIQVSSPGAEPFLRSAEDFLSSLGLMCSLRSWEKIESRDKFVMLIDSVAQDSQGVYVLLREGALYPKIYLKNVARAQALTYHPFSQSKVVKPQTKGQRAKKQKSLRS